MYAGDEFLAADDDAFGPFDESDDDASEPFCFAHGGPVSDHEFYGCER